MLYGQNQTFRYDSKRYSIENDNVTCTNQMEAIAILKLNGE